MQTDIIRNTSLGTASKKVLQLVKAGEATALDPAMSCPECGCRFGGVITHPDHGDIVCAECGHQYTFKWKRQPWDSPTANAKDETKSRVLGVLAGAVEPMPVGDIAVLGNLTYNQVAQSLRRLVKRQYATDEGSFYTAASVARHYKIAPRGQLWLKLWRERQERYG